MKMTERYIPTFDVILAGGKPVDPKARPSWLAPTSSPWVHTYVGDGLVKEPIAPRRPMSEEEFASWRRDVRKSIESRAQ